MVEVILLISSILFCTVSVYRARVGIRMAIQQRMLDIANCASGSISGDTLGALTPADIGSDGYERIYSTLAVFRDNVECEYVYCIRDNGGGSFTFVIDTDPEDPGEFGEAVKYTDALERAARGTASVDEVPYSDAWGEFYSAYSPVFDSAGKETGIIAVDFSADWFDSQLSEQTRSTVVSYAVILLLTLLLAALLSLMTVRPYVRLQGELLEEKVRAESASAAKSDFLANMSHEIRTPINAVLGMNEMILRACSQGRELPDSDTQGVRAALGSVGAYAADVESAGHNLLAIVNDILDFSKIEAGRMDLEEAPYRLGAVLSDVSNMIRFRARDKGLEFLIDVDESLPDELYGDAVRVRQILVNVLGNAVKYTERGSVRLTLRGERREGDTLLLTAAVRDTGVGIREEDQDRLFGKFERLDMQRNSSVEGTGLGLAITRRLLDLMGGTIAVESEYGRGSTFTVTIPQKIVSDAPVGGFRPQSGGAAPEIADYRESFRAPAARVLVVDDTKMNLTVAVSLLRDTLLRIDTASGGAEAVEMAKTTAYDVILMDQRMPEMDGTEALHRIRAMESGPNARTPVICLTADAVNGAKERYMAEGFSDYLTKPIDSHALEETLMKHLPPEKVEIVRETQAPAAEETGEDDGFGPLREAGIDPKTGLLYCRNDAEVYRSVLSEYARSEPEKTVSLRRFFAAEDWKNYGIVIHALKSSSKMIGAQALSEAAARLEQAANASDAGTIRASHGAMLTAYGKTASAIRAAVPDAETAAEDDGVMEFVPEEDVLEFPADGAGAAR